MVLPLAALQECKAASGNCGPRAHLLQRRLEQPARWKRPHNQRRNMRKGIPVSPGIAVARAYCVEHPLSWDEPHHLDAAALSGEITRFDEACNAAVHELDETIARVSQEIGDDEAAIFRAHRLLLRDNTFVNRVK